VFLVYNSLLVVFTRHCSYLLNRSINCCVVLPHSHVHVTVTHPPGVGGVAATPCVHSCTRNAHTRVHHDAIDFEWHRHRRQVPIVRDGAHGHRVLIRGGLFNVHNGHTAPPTYRIADWDKGKWTRPLIDGECVLILRLEDACRGELGVATVGALHRWYAYYSTVSLESQSITCCP
jgi:hypothetical protein